MYSDLSLPTSLILFVPAWISLFCLANVGYSPGFGSLDINFVSASSLITSCTNPGSVRLNLSPCVLPHFCTLSLTSFLFLFLFLPTFWVNKPEDFLLCVLIVAQLDQTLTSNPEFTLTASQFYSEVLCIPSFQQILRRLLALFVNFTSSESSCPAKHLSFSF